MLINGKCSYEENMKKSFVIFDKERKEAKEREEKQPEAVQKERGVEESICIENDLKNHWPIGTTKWKDILYDSMAITYEELQNYDEVQH